MSKNASNNLKSLAISTITAALILALAGLALVGCDSTKQSTDNGSTLGGQTVSLTEADDGTSRSVSVGGTVTITLAGNPTTGYAWESDLSEEDAALLELVGDAPTYVPDVVDSDVAGSGGLYAFTFKAVAAGQVELKLKYWRSFEADVEPIDTFSIDLTIE